MNTRKLKLIIKNPRVIIVLLCVLAALFFISPQLDASGVAISSVDAESPAALAGMQNPGASTAPTALERIHSVNGVQVNSVSEYAQAIAQLEVNDSVSIATSKGRYRITLPPHYRTVTLPELEEQLQQVERDGVLVNETTLVNRTVEIAEGTEELGIHVTETSRTNIRKGLDLQGGTRVLLAPTEPISDDDLALVVAGLNERLNVFGLSDVQIRSASDLSGNKNILVEIAGADTENVQELLAREGKFEAKVNNQTIFTGGRDIVNVCRSAECSGLDPNAGCQQTGSGWNCRFRFTITTTHEAAERQLTELKKLGVRPESLRNNGEGVLDAPLMLYLDDELVDELQISSSLRDSLATTIAISGSGEGESRNAALEQMNVEMRRLQTILITGSLPVKLEIKQTDSISPVLGDVFVKNAMTVGLVAILAVVSILFIVYRKISIALPMMLTSLLEIFLLLGVAAAIKWNIDLAAIAGIIAAIGSGVNDQIIITDEALNGEARNVRSWTEKFKNSIFIIMGSYLTLVVAMLPLFFIGAGLLRGFAVTTIIGVSAGVFITRPAYAKIVEILLKN